LHPALLGHGVLALRSKGLNDMAQVVVLMALTVYPELVSLNMDLSQPIDVALLTNSERQVSFWVTSTAATSPECRRLKAFQLLNFALAAYAR
jgi:hypothetical protein